MVHLAVTGVSCTFKTTYLKDTAGGLIKVKHGDFFEDTQIWPNLKTDSVAMKFAYLLMLVLNWKENVLTDRSPLDVIIYYYIDCLRNKTISLQMVYTEINNWSEFLAQHLWKWKIGVLIWNGDENELVRRMEKRNNGIDWLDPLYVRYQTLIFEHIANRFGWHTFYVNDSTSYMDLKDRLDLFFNICTPLNCHLLLPGAIMPKRMSAGSAGYDLHSIENVELLPNAWTTVDTGVAIELPNGTYGRVAGRSGLAFNNCVHVFGGTIDSDYRGSIKVLLVYFGDDSYFIKIGDRIAQLICEEIRTPVPVQQLSLPSTYRGYSGFASTGK